MNIKDIKKHPASMSTEKSKKLKEFNAWKILYYQDYLILGHVIDNIFPKGDFLCTNIGYGIVSRSLYDCFRKVISIDTHECFYDFLDERVKRDFRCYDELSPALIINSFENIININMTQYKDKHQRNLYLDFIRRHVSKNILLFNNIIDYTIKEEYISYFDKYGFKYDDDKILEFKNKSKNKFKNIQLDNLLIFEKGS